MKAFNEKHMRKALNCSRLEDGCKSNRDFMEYTMTLNAQETEKRKKYLDLSQDPNRDLTPVRSRNHSYFDPSNATLSAPKRMIA